MRGQPNPAQALFGEARGGDTNSPARAGKPRSSLRINYPIIVGFRALSSPAAGACWGQGKAAWPQCAPALLGPGIPTRGRSCRTPQKLNASVLPKTSDIYSQKEQAPQGQLSLLPKGTDSDKRHGPRVPHPPPHCSHTAFQKGKKRLLGQILYFSPQKETCSGLATSADARHGGHIEPGTAVPTPVTSLQGRRCAPCTSPRPPPPHHPQGRIFSPKSHVLQLHLPQPQELMA